MRNSSLKISRKIFGRIIRRERKKKELSLKELADKLNIDRQYVWRMENGKVNMSPDYLDKVIEKLNSRHEEFFNSI